MESTTYISIDVATKSLAIGVYRMKPFRDIAKVDTSDPVKLNQHLNSIINPIMMKVIDLIDGAHVKDVTIADKAVALKRTLIAIDDDIKEEIERDNVVVLIEYQMNANHGSNAIFNMIMYHYADRYPIQTIKPSWKNTIAFHPMLTLSTFLGCCSSNYKANKEHCRSNMIYLLTMIERMDMIKGIKKSNQDDIADTLMQCIAYHKQQQ